MGMLDVADSVELFDDDELPAPTIENWRVCQAQV